MPHSKWNKSETKAHSIMTMKKPTSLMGKHPNNLGTVGKMIFSIPTYRRTHCISFSKILMRHLSFKKILPGLANNDIPLQSIIKQKIMTQIYDFLNNQTLL
jgi:hypothetical protein